MAKPTLRRCAYVPQITHPTAPGHLRRSGTCPNGLAVVSTAATPCFSSMAAAPANHVTGLVINLVVQVKPASNAAGRPQASASYTYTTFETKKT